MLKYKRRLIIDYKKAIFMKDKKVNGTLILEKIDFNRMLERTVHRSNKSSGKITLPSELIGEKVFVIIPKKGGK